VCDGTNIEKDLTRKEPDVMKTVKDTSGEGGGELLAKEARAKTSEGSVRFEVFTAVTMKNVVFCDIRTQFVLHRRHYFSATESSQLMLCKI
jgi:hypothetical protein